MNKRTESFRDLGIQWIGVELNNTCNIRCSFCPMSIPNLQRPIDERILDKTSVFKILKEIKDDGTLQYVDLSGYGEPFLYPHLEDVLKYCKENGIRMRFGTNGTNFSRDNIKLLDEYEPEEIVISIQSFLRDDYRKVKKSNIDYDAWLDGIAEFLKIHMEENMSINVQLALASNSNNSIMNKICGMRLGDVNIPYPNRQFYRNLRQFVEEFCVNRLKVGIDNQGFKRIRKTMYTHYYSINERICFEIKAFFDSTNFYTFKETGLVSCHMPYLIINSQEKVLMCCADFTGGTSLGDVKKRTIKEIAVENYNAILNSNNEKAKFEICRKCKGERTYRGLVLMRCFSWLRNQKRKTLELMKDSGKYTYKCFL